MELADFFTNHPDSRQLFEALQRMVDSLGPVELRVTKSQVAFRRRRAFAWAWLPEMYLRRKAASLVLTVGLRRQDPSPRWKQVVQPAPGRFTHHLELYSANQLDAELRAWLQEAWEQAG